MRATGVTGVGVRADDGGRQQHELVDLRVTPERVAALEVRARGGPDWELTRRQRCDLELLATGGFSPLVGFLEQEDHESVCEQMRLASGALWPVPVTLDVPADVARAAGQRRFLALRSRGQVLAVLHVRSAWRPDRRAEAASVFGTTDPAHPGVDALLHATHDWNLGGRLEVLRLPEHHAFRDLRHTPAELRAELARRGWERVVGFQTRNPMHRAHQELTLRAARDVGGKLLLHPVVGITKPGDVDPFVRVRCYRSLLRSYPDDSVLLSVLPLAMRMAGPREAVWHAIIRRNHGATHFIVGRDHAGPGEDLQGRPFYDPYAAQELVSRHEDEIGIRVVPFRRMVYVQDVDGYLPEDEVQPGQRCLHISGTQQRERLAQGMDLPSWFTPPEVAAELRRAFPVRQQQGLVVVLHAPFDRSGPALGARLREAGRDVTLLDGTAGPAGTAPGVVERLTQAVVRNGGVVVRHGPGPGGAPAPCGDALLLEVSPTGAGVEPRAAGALAPLRVAAGTAPHEVATAVCAHLHGLGFLAAQRQG